MVCGQEGWDSVCQQYMGIGRSISTKLQRIKAMIATKLPRRTRRHQELPRGRPVLAWLTAGDFRDALREAGITLLSDEAPLEKLASAMSQEIDNVLGARGMPVPRDLEAAAAELEAIEWRSAAVIAAMLDGLDFRPGDGDPVQPLAEALLRSHRVALVALRSAARGNDPSGDPARAVAQALVAVDQLRDWAGAAARPYRQAAARARQREIPDIRQLPPQLGHRLIAEYESLTGRKARVSRAKPDGASAGAPGGPLIRYLALLFERIRSRLANDRATQEMARDRAWSPKPETLMAWVKDYRRVR
jgi:hypothetical protein